MARVVSFFCFSGWLFGERVGDVEVLWHYSAAVVMLVTNQE